MKRLLYSLLAFAALLSAASCVKEPVSVPDPADGGIPVPVTFNLDLGLALSKADAPASTALDDGSRVNKVFAAVFGSDGSLISTSRIGGTGYDATATMSGGKASVTITLSRGQEYKVVFFAQKDDTYTLSFADGNRATFAYKQGLKANDPDLDAFWAVVDVTSSVTSYNVTLKRPFAQVNVLVPAGNVPEGKTQFSSAMTVKAAPVSFDLFAGKAGSDVKDLTFADNAIAAPAFGKYAPAGGVAAYQWVAMNFVLVPASGKVDLSFREKDMPGALELSGIPVKTNGRTNLVGALYAADEVDGTFNVWIDSGISGGGEQKTDAEPTEITIADGSTYTTEKPLVIDAAGAPMTKVRLSVNGHSFSEVLAGADGGAITAESANPAVATAKVEGDEVVITPVDNGETVVTIYTPAYTKTDYQGGVFKLPVKVTGVEVVKKTPVISVTAPADGKLALEVGGTFSIKASVLDGQQAVEGLPIIFASSDATVASVDKDGVVKALKAGEATLTLTTESNAGYEAAEPVTIAVTVKEAEEPGGDEPDEPGGGDFYVKVTGAQTDWSGDYLIVYEEGSLAFNGGLTTLDAAKNTIAVTIVDGKIASTDETDAAVFTIAATEGGYSIKSASGQYIGNTKQASGAPANGLTPGADPLLNTISFSDGAPLIVSNTTELKYNKASGDERFRYYKAGNKQQAIALYKLGGAEGGDDPGESDTPVTTTLTVTPESLALEVGAAGTLSVETNSSATPLFSSDDESVAKVDASGKVTAIAEGSTEIIVEVEAVEGKFTAAAKTVSVTVVKPTEAPEGVLKVSVAEFNAAADSYTQKYQLTGVISKISNTTYGNFDLTDGTGTVYVYGLTATEQGLQQENGVFNGKANNDKSFASLGLREGDTVTLIGYRYTYKRDGADDKIEVLGAYYVSHVPGGSQISYEPNIRRYEIPAIDLKYAEDKYTEKNETFGNTMCYTYETNNPMQRVVMHTYEYNNKVYTNYTALVDGNKKAPLWSAFVMNSTDYPDKNVGRVGSWTVDPGIPPEWQQESSGSGYSRGHFVASNYRQTNGVANKQTFYYTNQALQFQTGFNDGVWNSLESAVKSHAPSGQNALYVVVGVLYKTDKTVGGVPCPSHFYKLLMMCGLDSEGNVTSARGTAYLFSNETHKGKSYSDDEFSTTIDAIEAETGFDFFANIPDNLEEQAEKQSASLW